jgi:hypothetical protein
MLCRYGQNAKGSHKAGSVAWLAQIVIKRGGKIFLPENKRFDRRPMPEAGAVNPARLKPRSNAE